MSGRWLSDAADGDGHALSRLRRHVEDLLVARGHPLHAGSIVTSVLAGWDGRYPDEVADHPELFEPVGHHSTRTAPVPPGALAIVPTRTKLGELYGEVVCNHPDPDVDEFEADGQLVSKGAPRHRVVVDFHCMPAGLQDIPEPDELARIRRAGTWLSCDGHVHYRANTPMPADALALYGQWLAHPSRSSVREGLPDDADRIVDLTSTLMSELTGYRATFVTFGRWIWLRAGYEALLGDANGRLNRDELRRTLGLLSATYGSDHAARTVAYELMDASQRWPDSEREHSTAGAAWVRSLFVANAFVAERLTGGAPIVATRDGPVQLAVEPSWELAGLWHVEALDDDQVEALRSQARQDAEDRAITAMGRDLVETAPFPFTMRLSQDQFEHGELQLSEEVVGKLEDGHVTVRLAFQPHGRFAAHPVAVATTGVPVGGRLAFDWPALLPVGAVLDGRVTRRGRLIELEPAHR